MPTSFQVHDVNNSNLREKTAQDPNKKSPDRFITS
jgi:hypothetical protein